MIGLIKAYSLSVQLLTLIKIIIIMTKIILGLALLLSVYLNSVQQKELEELKGQKIDE